MGLELYLNKLEPFILRTLEGRGRQFHTINGINKCQPAYDRLTTIGLNLNALVDLGEDRGHNGEVSS